MRLLAHARSVLRVLQAASDAVDLLDKALRKEVPRKQVGNTTQVKEVTDLHLLFYEYNGYWPENKVELKGFAEAMGFDE